MAGYLLLITVVVIESLTHVPPLAAPPLATAASALGLGALAAAGAVTLYGLAYRALGRAR